MSKTKISEENVEALGKIVDDLDSALYTARLPLDPQIHVLGLTSSIRAARDNLAVLVSAIAGENPWADNPLEG